jgi:hypothetical protein
MITTPKRFSNPLSNARWVFLLLTVLLGLLILWPWLHFQDWLSAGDHGRDLEAAQEVLRGKTVYRDYWWVYGPLMPYYYAIFYKIFGISIQSILLGKFLIKLTAGILCYLAVSISFRPLTALMATLWFWTFAQDFFFTYSHIGGIMMVMAVIWCLMRYIREQKTSTLWQGLILCFVLSMIKVNFGLSSLATLMASVFFVDRMNNVPFSSPKKLFYFLGIIAVPGAIFLIYWQLLSPLPLYEIRQCLPYSNADQPYNTTPWSAVVSFLKIAWGEASRSAALLIFYILTFFCLIQTSIVWFKNELEPKQKKILTMTVIVLSIYILANFHEYLKSGVWYRWFWAQPPLIVLVFIIFETATQNLHKIIRSLLWAVIALMVGIIVISSWQAAIRFKNPQQKIAGARGGVYVANPEDWVQTVNATTEYLNNTLKPDETFFALPYDIIYYYLTGRPSPSRQTIFFEHINIPLEQERKIIQEIEEKKVNYIVVSNRFMSPERGLGTLGKTYCPVIGKYINDNFIPVIRFGDWQHVPGWGWAHGTMILKRKAAL